MEDDVQIAYVIGDNTSQLVARHDLVYEAFVRTGDMVRFKCYNRQGKIVWITMRQTIVEEAVFGDTI